ncbi:rhodanese-like domain-containing protein [Geodermatophilus chilensis]|uniref:rhodanese-like domain-containing protein n=1 Tax=Geodermatophilus chilensis TaxID=2035835 RepID=UPI002FCD7568
MRTGDVVVLDVRPPAEYAAGHLPDAVKIPPDELEARLRGLPDGQPIVAYCRGPLCAYADTAVRTLTAQGRPALRLVDGLPEWDRRRPARRAPIGMTGAPAAAAIRDIRSAAPARLRIAQSTGSARPIVTSARRQRYSGSPVRPAMGETVSLAIPSPSAVPQRELQRPPGSLGVPHPSTPRVIPT